MKFGNDQVSDAETAEILRLAEGAAAIDGDFAEFGCYRGDTTVRLAKILAEKTRSLDNRQLTHDALLEGASKTNSKRLFAYDSFAGLPEKTDEDISSTGVNFQGGALHVSRRALVDKLKRARLHNVVIKKAWFDELTDWDVPERIALAFIDGDFYASQKQALRLVIPRLAEGGVIICHDYNNPELPGATRAVDELIGAEPGWKLRVYQTLAILTRTC